MLSPAERDRYARHLALPEVGERGQKRLKQASVLVVGAGGLGSPAALYLAAAGVGRIGVIDHDTVDATNLQRQVLYGQRDVGRSKARAARDRLLDLNPHIEVDAYATRLTSDNALETVGSYDVVVDGSDNFPTRYLVNDACVLTGVPDAYGSIFRFEGQASVFAMPSGPCYRCLYARPPPADAVPSCAEAGVLGVLPGLVGSLQATEAIKLLLGVGNTLAGRLLLVDALTMEFTTLRVARDPACAVCGRAPTITAPIDYETFCNMSGTAATEPVPAIDAVALRAQLDRGEPNLVLVDVRSEAETRSGMLPGACHIPLDELERRMDEVPSDRTVVAYCRTGARSARAVRLLQAGGHPNVANLTGGLLAWNGAPLKAPHPKE